MIGPFVATLAMDFTWSTSLDNLVDALKEKVPLLGSEISGRHYEGEMAAAEEAYIISVGGSHYAVAYVAKPISGDRFSNAIAYAVERWADAANDLSGHRGHVIVSNLKAARSFRCATDAAGSITAIASVLCDLGPTKGVHWAGGEVLQAPQDFLALADLLIGGHPPIDPWITVRAHLDEYIPDETPVLVVSTLGLREFCGREVEIIAPPVSTAQACDRVLAVTADILRNGPDLADNSTIRIGNDDLIRVNLVDHGRLSSNQPVISLTVIEDEPDVPDPDPGLVASNAPLFKPRRRSKPFAT